MNVAILLLNAGRGSGEVARQQARHLVDQGHRVHFMHPALKTEVSGAINAEIEFVPTEPGAAKADSDEESEDDEAAEGEESSERKSPDVEWNVSFKTKDARPSDEQPQPTEDELLADD